METGYLAPLYVCMVKIDGGSGYYFGYIWGKIPRYGKGFFDVYRVELRELRELRELSIF